MAIFTIIVLFFICIEAGFSGISEGLHLAMMNRTYRGSHKDIARKTVDTVRFLAFFALPIAVAITAFDYELSTWWIASALLLAGAIRWLLRDGFQNLQTGKNFFYTGTVAFVDRILGSSNVCQAALRKIIVLVIAAVTFHFLAHI